MSCSFFVMKRNTDGTRKDDVAFISYQRKDEGWTDRLRNKLEHYRLPSA